MTLIGAILKQVQSKESMKKYSSPPPEIDDAVIERRFFKKNKKPVDKYAHVVARVDSSPPRLQPRRMFRRLGEWRRRLVALHSENVKLLIAIKRQHFLGGRVDCHWAELPRAPTEHYEKRKHFLKRVERANKYLHQLIVTARPRVTPTASLNCDWCHNRQQIIKLATKPFVLFPPVLSEEMEDTAFLPPPGVIRPRVHLILKVQGGAYLGTLTVELFTEVCPLTCQLFTELVDGDGLGHGYVGTCFFRKVPNLYWSGGDVIQDNGFGCYAQRGRRAPVGAENYHYPHSMPGLLSMRTTPNDEMCGMFNITFKPLPQLDLRSVVFGRVIRPCRTYEAVRALGSALSSQPIVRVAATRRRADGGWVRGRANERLATRFKLLKGLF